MKLKSAIIYTSSLITVMAMGAFLYFYHNPPSYIRDAVAGVSSKMSYSYGLSECVADMKNNDWELICSPESEAASLEFIVKPQSSAPYEVSTSFYLIAKNAAARDAASKGANESLLAYLKINPDNN